jgi:chromate reductase
MRPRILMLNGSPGGSKGNTATLLDRMAAVLTPNADPAICHLAEMPDADWDTLLRASDGVVLATGTYWDGWGSPLQRFLEATTPLEATAAWIGKPVACLVTAHAVGGKGVLSRLQGVVNTLGALIPPFGGLVLTEAGQIAASAGHADMWSTDDLAIVAHNLVEACRGGRDWRAWPVDRGDPGRLWLAPD